MMNLILICHLWFGALTLLKQIIWDSKKGVTGAVIVAVWVWKRMKIAFLIVDP